jgi:hypothetical protein
VLKRTNDVEIDDSAPGPALILESIWFVHELELLLKGGFARLCLTEKEKLVEKRVICASK